MTDTIWSAIAGGATGIVTGSISSLLAPWAIWGIEKRRQKLAYRRELIAKWRRMLSQAASSEAKNQTDLMKFLERHHDFYSLKAEARHLFSAGRTSVVLADRPVGTIPNLLDELIDEVGRIERKWELV